MQYFPVIDSTRNVYADYDGFYQHLSNVNGTSDCSPYYNSPLLPSLTTHVLLNTEVIKQTVFRHEAIFRNQVIELHRLYDKQWELMNQLKNDFGRGNTHVELASSEYSLMDQKQSNGVLLNTSHVAHIQPFQLEVGKTRHADKVTPQVECASRQCELLDASRCKKYNNKVLDLQLLATEYMDDEDDRFSVDEETIHPVRHTSPLSPTNDGRVDQRPLGLDIQEKGPHAESASTRPILFDLNKPFNFEEATSTMSHEELLFKDLSGNTTQLFGSSCSSATDKHVPASVADFNDAHNHETIVKLSYDHEAGHITGDLKLCNQESNPKCFSMLAEFPSLKPKGCSAHSGADQRMKRSSKKRTLKSRKDQGSLAFYENNAQDTLKGSFKSLQLIPISDKSKNHSKHVFSPVQSMLDFRRNPIAVQALPCTHAPVRMRNKKSKPFLKVTIDKSCPENGLLNPMVDLVNKLRKGKKSKGNLRAKNINYDSYQLGPLSTENEEWSPPRGESDENHLDMQCRFYAVEDGDAETDVARIAAKAILFLSAADVRINRCSHSESSLVCHDNPLHWFADVVSVESQKESFSNFDDFETMTLKLKDTSPEEQYCRSIISRQDEKLTSVATVSGRATGVRGKRSKKLKDFQGVVLPSISSLSKHEVTEDLQFIECLMEATETSKIFGSKKRNGCFRGKRHSGNAAPIITENSRCLPLDLQNNTSSEYHANERRPMMIDWGKITRRRRGQRLVMTRDINNFKIAKCLIPGNGNTTS